MHLGVGSPQQTLRHGAAATEAAAITLTVCFVTHTAEPAKAKGDAVPMPPTPPKQRRMVGPLRPSPHGQLAPGDAVEVRQLARGSRGSWRLATVKQARVQAHIADRRAKGLKMRTRSG